MSSFADATSLQAQSSDGVRPDPYFSSIAHETAYNHLLDGIRTHAGCILLTGAADSGKTLLLHRLIHDQSGAIQFVYCSGDRLEFDQLLGFICAELALPLSSPGRSGYLRAINDYLDACVANGVVVALLLDNAHLLHDTVLGQLIVLKIARAGRDQRTLRLVLSGLPSLRDRMAKRHAFAAKKSNPLGIYLDGFNSSETSAFIRSQYAAAAAFSEAEIDEIHKCSRGMPGIIEKLCSEKTGYEQRGDNDVRQQALTVWKPSASAGTSPMSTTRIALAAFVHRAKQKLQLSWRNTPALAALSLALGLLTGASVLTSLPERVSSDDTDPIKTANLSEKAVARQEQIAANENTISAAMTMTMAMTISPERQNPELRNTSSSNDVFAIDAEMRIQQATPQTHLAVTALLEKARTALENKALTTPEDDSAVKWAEKALRIDPENKAANEILSVVIDHYLYWSAQKLEDRQLQSASHYLDKAQSLQHYASQTQIAVVAVLEGEIRSHQHSVVDGKTATEAKIRSDNTQSFVTWVNSIDGRMKRFGERMNQRMNERGSGQSESSGFSSAR